MKKLVKINHLNTQKVLSNGQKKVVSKKNSLQMIMKLTFGMRNIMKKKIKYFNLLGLNKLKFF